MNHEVFFNRVRESVSKYMGDEYNVSLNTVVKNNGLELTGIVIMQKSKSAAPTIYLDDYYAEYVEGRAFSDIVKNVLEIYEANDNNFDLDFGFFSDYDKIKPRIMYKLLNYESNKKLLADVPHKNYMDLAVVFYVMIDHDTIGNGSVLIHNNHAKMWHVSEDDLYETAISNTPKLMQYRFSSMENVVGEIFGTEDAADYLDNNDLSNHDMYVLTNTRKLFGAACMLYDGLLKRISKKLNSSLYIIPSSIHELIIIPKKAFPYDKEELIEMVRTINANEVDIVDVLSDNVYEYILDAEELLY